MYSSSQILIILKYALNLFFTNFVFLALIIHFLFPIFLLVNSFSWITATRKWEFFFSLKHGVDVVYESIGGAVFETCLNK